MTRRGGQVLVGFVLTLILVAVAAGIPPAGSAAGATTNLTTTQRQAYDVWHAHVVAPGETLWDLAVRFAPDTDPRETVLRLQQVNQLPSTLLPAGRLVLVPAVSAVGSPPESRR